ncbi:MAG: MlaD family protein [Ignavibacteriaceae bacterium]|nr:MlaD family protein [Ignavibacteriaceae bacterium]
MKFKLRYSEKIVGTFLIAALIIIAASTGYLLLHNKVFEKKFLFKAKFGDAVGLSSSTPVYFRGFKIGVITDYELTEDNYILADFKVYEEFRKKIVKKSALLKSVNPVTSTSTIEFLQGPENFSELAEGSMIPAIDIPEGEILLAKNMVKKTGDPLSTVIYNLAAFSENINKDNNVDKGAFFRALVNMADAAEGMKKITDNLNIDIESISKPDKYGRRPMASLVVNAAQISDSLRVMTGLVNHSLMRLDTVITAYSQPEGLVAKMIDPDGKQIIEPIRKTISNLNDVLPKLEKFSEFLVTQQGQFVIILKQLVETLDEVQVTFETINNGPLIGKPKSERKK